MERLAHAQGREACSPGAGGPRRMNNVLAAASENARNHSDVLGPENPGDHARETGGDAVSMSLRLGCLVSSGLFLVAFAAAVLAQARASRFRPAYMVDHH